MRSGVNADSPKCPESHSRSHLSDHTHCTGEPFTIMLVPMAEFVLDRVTLLTMDAERRVLDDAWVAVSGGRIEAVGTGEAPAAERRIDGRGGVAMPGMVSTHQHVIDILLRGGLEQDRSLFDWLVKVY